MSATTTVGDAINAFVTLVTNACAPLDSTIQVCDGPPVRYLAEDYVLIRGWDYEMQEPASLGGGPNGFQIEEHYEITGLIRSYRGDSVQADTRARALAIFAAIQQAVRTDPSLGGVIRVCWMDKGTGTQGPTSHGGTACEIDFALHCEARLI